MAESTSKVSSKLDLFGGDRPWTPTDWNASDDRVRGGASQSYLSSSPSGSTAFFYGTLDIKTLGGAGFASQRTDHTWDLSGYDGVAIRLKETDGKRYTLTLKDEIQPRRDDGHEQSSLSWEVDFSPADAEQIGGIGTEAGCLFFAWDKFKPTYRGRDKDPEDVKPLDLGNIKRIGLMMRSFFARQEGPFALSITSISAVKQPSGSKLVAQALKQTQMQAEMQVPRSAAIVPNNSNNSIIIPSSTITGMSYRDDPEAATHDLESSLDEKSEPALRNQATRQCFSSCVVC